MRVKGLFTLQDTYGFPLSDSLNKCYEKGLIPHLENYIGEALLHNWTDDKISDSLITSYADSKFGKMNIDIKILLYILLENIGNMI